MIPENEAGVLVCFSQQAAEKGVEIVKVQTAFPDLQISVSGAVYNVELEFRASNFIAHGHDPQKCDLIVCWENDLGKEFTFPVVALAWPWSVDEIRAPTEAERQAMYWRQRALIAEKELSELKLSIPAQANQGGPPITIANGTDVKDRRASLPTLLKAGINRRTIAEIYKVHESTIARDLQAIGWENGERNENS